MSITHTEFVNTNNTPIVYLELIKSVFFVIVKSINLSSLSPDDKFFLNYKKVL